MCKIINEKEKILHVKEIFEKNQKLNATLKIEFYTNCFSFLTSYLFNSL